MNLVVTAQSAKENYKEVATHCKAHQIDHYWIELEGANQALLSSKKVVNTLGRQIACLFNRAADSSQPVNIMLHCAAGIHRTGTIAYVLLRLSGYEPSQALEALGQMRA